MWAKISYPSGELSLDFFWYFVFCKSLLLGVEEILSALNYLFYFIAFILTVLSEGEKAWAWDIKGVCEKGGEWRMTPVLGAAQVVRRRWAVGIAVWAGAVVKLHCYSRTQTHTCAHSHTRTHTFVHADSDIMHGCPLRFIIKALSGYAGSEGENMNRIKQIVWCVKDRHSSSKVLKLLLPMDWQGRRVGARNECSPLSLPSPPLFITRSFQSVASLFMQGPSVSMSRVN